MPTADELITRALNDRAATVAPGRLRYPEFRPEYQAARPPVPRQRFHRPPPALFAAAASVVLVLAIAIAAYALYNNGDQQSPAAGGSTISDTPWHLTGVHSATRSYPVPAGYRAELTFGANGRFAGQDGPNALAGTYDTSGNTMTLRVTEAGTAGGTNTFPAQEAMSSIYVSSSPNDDSVTSTFTVTATTLTLSSGRWTLTFSADTPATSAPPALPSATSTHR